MSSDVYQPDVRRINGPVVMVLRKMPHSRTPWRQIPVAQRRAALRFVHTANLVIKGNDQTELIYPHGLVATSDRGYEVALEVFPGAWRSQECQTAFQRGNLVGESPTRNLRLKQLAHGHVAISRRPERYDGSTITGQEHVTIMRRPQLGRYLVGLLPAVGVDERDVNAVLQDIDTLLNAGARTYR